ncbi:MAG TPA: hypothetical protein DD716_00075 [Thiomicrospira sp.]|jgi:hypothetical protein|nr:hypothetical protein [Thiomicrospira sp.]
MDIWQKIFLFLGSLIAASFLLVTLIVLSNAEGGMLTTESVAHLVEPMSSFYHFAKWFVYVWMVSAIVIFVRFLKRMFGK